MARGGVRVTATPCPENGQPCPQLGIVQTQMATLLEQANLLLTVANNVEWIRKAQENDQKRYQDEMEEMFGRVRALEIQLGQARVVGVISLTVLGPAVGYLLKTVGG